MNTVAGEFYKFWSLQRHAIRLLLRDRVALFWSFAFPIIVFGLMATTTGRFYPVSPTGANGLMVIGAGVISIAIMTGGLFGIGVYLVGLRQSGVLLRYRMLPINVLLIIAGAILRNFLVTITSIIGIIIVLRYVFGVTDSISIGPLSVIAVFGIVGFSCLGVLLTCFVRTAEASTALCNILFYVFMFSCGATYPRFLMPDWLTYISKYLPATQLMDALNNIFYNAGDLHSVWHQLLYFAFLAIFSTLFALFKFTWA